jgi:hypothetical protein
LASEAAEPDPIVATFARGCCLDGERRKSEDDGKNDREPDQLHGHLGEDGWRRV